MAPLTDAKQSAIVAGVASLLGSGVQASDISLTVPQDSSQVLPCPHVRNVQCVPAQAALVMA